MLLELISCCFLFLINQIYKRWLVIVNLVLQKISKCEKVSKTMRIDEVLAHHQLGSKKDIKRLFQRRLVKINDEIIINGSFNVESQIHTLTVNEKEINIPKHRYYLMNKPAGVVTARKDSNCRTIIDVLRPEDRYEQLYPVGRLDRDTEGLLLITDNGPLGYQLLIPKKKVLKTYEAIINEEVSYEDVLAFRKGIVFIGGVKCLPAKLTILSSNQGTSKVQLTIQEGKFHQVKKMFLAQGKKVIYLKRIEMGPLKLESSLQPGEYRDLSVNELHSLSPYFKYKSINN